VDPGGRVSAHSLTARSSPTKRTAAPGRVRCSSAAMGRGTAGIGLINSKQDSQGVRYSLYRGLLLLSERIGDIAVDVDLAQY
jgi:hypothetical protein